MTASYIAAIRDTPDEHRSLNDQIILALVAEMDGLFEQNERQATNIGALYRQRRDAELACELSREENRRLVEQFEALRSSLQALVDWADGKAGDDFGDTEWTRAREALKDA